MRMLRTVQVSIDYSKLDDLRRIHEVREAIDMITYDLERKIKTLVRACVCGQPALADIADVDVYKL